MSRKKLHGGKCAPELICDLLRASPTPLTRIEVIHALPQVHFKTIANALDNMVTRNVIFANGMQQKRTYSIPTAKQKSVGAVVRAYVAGVTPPLRGYGAYLHSGMELAMMVRR